MPVIKEIALNDFIVLQDYGTAIPSKLLLVAQDINAVGMRCVFSPADGLSNPGFVPLEGDKFGAFISDENISYRAALDVSALVQIVIGDSTAERVSSAPLNVGDICIVYGRDEICMAIAHPSNPTAVGGHLILTGDKKGHIVGGSGARLRLGRASLKALNAPSSAGA